MAATLGPAPFKFEHALPSPWFNFNGGAGLTQIEGGSIGSNPPEVLNLDVQRILQTNQACYFQFQWSISGLILPSLNPENQWHLQVYFEQLGGGEINLGAFSHLDKDLSIVNNSTIPLTTAGTSYNQVIAFPANSVPEGIYDVVGVIRMVTPSHQPLWVAAFAEMGKVQFYKDNP